jgi:hypothetical protein
MYVCIYLLQMDPSPVADEFERMCMEAAVAQY